MSLQVLNAHTGHCLSADPTAFDTLDAFKAWLAEAASVPSTQQILLTAAGKQAKYPGLLGEPEIFLYNRQLVASSSTRSSRTLIAPTPKPDTFAPIPPPDTVVDQNDLQAWQSLFEARRLWSNELVENSLSIAQTADEHFGAIIAIERGVGVAVGNLQSHVKTLEQKYDEACVWAQQAVAEQETLLAGYTMIKPKLRSIPAKQEFLHFLPKLRRSGDARRGSISSRSTPTLASFLDSDSGDNARTTVQEAVKWINERTNHLGSVVRQVAADSNELVDDVEKAQAQTRKAGGADVAQLMEEIEVMAKKVESDNEHVAGLPSGPRSVSQASKMASLHTRNLLPSLNDFCLEMGDIIHLAVDQRNEASTLALTNMQKIATIESTFARVNSQVLALDLSKEGAEAIDTLSVLSQLPFVYGALLIEAVRRREWSDKLKSESAAVAEDIAGQREEEQRRRRKWLKSLGNLISEDAAGGAALNFELNLQPEGKSWPEVSRDDISDYFEALRRANGLDEVVEELSEVAKDIERPSRSQQKKIKGFKMGSIHEAEIGKGSILIRDAEELRMMRDANQKLEEELKNQKSRVRKLEDLVYKHAQSGRSTSGNIFQLSDSPRPASPLPMVEGSMSPSLSPKGHELLSRRMSVNSRQASVNKSSDERALARRIVALEAELHEEKQKHQVLESAAQKRKDEDARMKSDFEEVHATKRDLMANMDAQQREFANERRLLQEEVNKYKLKSEDFDDELDRLMGSRDNERSTFDEKVRLLEAELEDSKQTLQNLQANHKEKEEVQEDQTRILRLVHSNLAPERPIPASVAELIHRLDELAESASRHVKELGQAVASARAEKDVLQSSVDRCERDLATSRRQLGEFQDEAAALRSDAAVQKARSECLTTDLEDGRYQLRILRAKFAEGETGSEALQQRVEEQAAKASTLSTQLAEAQSRVSSLDQELATLQQKQHKLEHEAVTSTKRLEHRSGRDRELTQRIAACNDELTHLLEALGLSIVERDGTMAIQRTSKLSNASTTLLDSATPPLANAKPFDVTIDPASMSWMQTESPEDENMLFQKFLAQADVFNMNKFSEAIIKLRRDVEWTGKKWKAEARGYRDKYHRVQNDSHDKIAFRSFREGDLALFLPTRNQATRPWAAFNVGAPHYFLREQDSHKLQNREWLVARISKVEERVVDLSKTMEGGRGSDGRSIGETSEGGISFEDDNPFELSDGLRWYLLDAAEEKAGAPSTPGLGKTTVASANVDAKGSVRMKKLAAGYDASTKLNKSLESRRSSTTSKRGSISGPSGREAQGSSDTPATDVSRVPSSTHLRPGSQSSVSTVPPPLPGPSGLGIEIARSPEEVRNDQMFGP